MSEPKSLANTEESIYEADIATATLQLARFGFTHVEVNGLAFPEPIEEGVEGEIYPRFYTYCPALDQFAVGFGEGRVGLQQIVQQRVQFVGGRTSLGRII